MGCLSACLRQDWCYCSEHQPCLQNSRTRVCFVLQIMTMMIDSLCRHALNLVQCRALVVTETLKSSNYVKMLHELCPEISQCEYATRGIPYPHLYLNQNHHRQGGRALFCQ